MAERYLIASGNISNPANWFGGIKPAVGDVAHANGFTGTIDEDMTCDELTTAAGATAVAGGRFEPNAGITVTANIRGGGTGASNVIEMGAAASGGTFHVIGNLLGGSGIATRAILVNSTLENAHILIDGDVSAGNGNAARGFDFLGGTNVTARINGNVFGGATGANRQGVHIGDQGTGLTLLVNGNVFGSNNSSEAINAAGININGQADSVIVTGQVIGRLGNGIFVSPGSSSRDGMIIEVYGMAIGNILSGVAAIHDAAIFQRIIKIYGGTASLGLDVLNSQGVITVHGSSSGGSLSGLHGIRNQSTSSIDVRGAAVGGSHPGAHGVLNSSTGTIRVGGQSITNPSGALGISNPGGGQVVIGYADFFDPVLRFVTEGVTPKLVIGSWAKNATHITVANPTVDVKDVSFNSVIGGPQAMTVDGTDPRLMKYEHGSNIFARGNPYFLIFGGEHEGQAIPETIHPIRF